MCRAPSRGSSCPSSEHITSLHSLNPDLKCTTTATGQQQLQQQFQQQPESTESSQKKKMIIDTQFLIVGRQQLNATTVQCLVDKWTVK